MAKNNDYFTGGKPCNDSQMHGLKSLHGEAKREEHPTGKSVEYAHAGSTGLPPGTPFCHRVFDLQFPGTR
jgi:hypothetical protein